MQSMLNNPEMMRNMMRMNPQLNQAMEQNPELARMMEDPDVMNQTMQMMRNPSLMREMQRNQDRAIGNLDVMPGGHNALVRAHEDVIDPLMGAITGTSQSGASGTTNTYSQQNEGGPNNQALPNPWGAPAPAPAPAAPAATGATPAAGAGGSDPMQAMMQQMMSNPEMMQQSMQMAGQMFGAQQGAAGGQAAPGGGDMNAMMQQMMSNPEMMQQSMQMAQQMAGNQQGAAAGAADAANPMAGMIQQLMSNPGMMQQSMEMAQMMGGQQGANVTPLGVPLEPGREGPSMESMTPAMTELVQNPERLRENNPMANFMQRLNSNPEDMQRAQEAAAQMFGGDGATPPAGDSTTPAPTLNPNNPFAPMMQQLVGNNPQAMAQMQRMAQGFIANQQAQLPGGAGATPAPAAVGGATAAAATAGQTGEAGATVAAPQSDAPTTVGGMQIDPSNPYAGMMQQMMANPETAAMMNDPAQMAQSRQMAYRMVAQQMAQGGYAVPGMPGMPGLPGAGAPLPTEAMAPPEENPTGASQEDLEAIARVQFAAQLAQLATMGFCNEAACLKALRQNHGRVDGALNSLLNDGGD